MNEGNVSHAELLEAIESLRGDISPLVTIKDDLDEVVEIMRAFRIGGKGVKWVASIATALITVGGLMLGLRAIWQSFWNGGG